MDILFLQTVNKVKDLIFLNLFLYNPVKIVNVVW